MSDTDSLLGLAFLISEQPVGLVLMKTPPLAPPWVMENEVSLHALKIAEAYQGQRLGREAFGLALQMVRPHWPGAVKLVLAVDAGNMPALSVYRSFGMTDSGPVYSGRIGFEHRLTLQLT